MEELWRPVVGVNKYEVSNLGQIRNARTKRILKGSEMNTGYLKVNLYISKDKIVTRTIHSVVAEAFVPNPEGLPEVDHIDTNKFNNAADNLR